MVPTTMNDKIIAIYMTGIEWSIILSITIAILFAMSRWISCIKQYIKTGDIDIREDSAFFGKNNWFWGRPERHIGHDENNNSILVFYRGNNPWAVGVDIITISFVLSCLSAIWPISNIVMFTILFAKWSRNKVVKKELFINRLKGKNV